MFELILLDRDGVLNQDSADYIKSPAEWQPLPDAAAAVALLRQDGRRVAICTNQSGVGRGLYSANTLTAIHAKLSAYLSEHNTQVDHIYWCPHVPDDQCRCRKPAPGMLQQAMQDFAVKSANTAFVGDSLRDLQAAAAAHCQAVLVLTGNGQQTAAQLQAPEFADLARSVIIAEDLSAAAKQLVAAA